MALAQEAGEPASFGQKPSPRSASDSLSPNAGTHGLFADPRGPCRAKCSGLRASPACRPARQGQHRGLQPWQGSGRPPPPDGEVRLGPQHAGEGCAGRARRTASCSLCSRLRGPGPAHLLSTKATGAREDQGCGWTETQRDRCSAFAGHRSRRQCSSFTARKKKERKKN